VPSMMRSESQSLDIWRTDRTGRRILVLVSVVLATMSVQARSQSQSLSDNSSSNAGSAAPVKPDITYVRPTPRTTVRNYTFDTFGPYAFAGTALTAGLDQATNTPPEWKQGFGGYADRFGSDFGIALVGTTTRYGLAKAFKEDTSYYRCECRGVFSRMRHAVLSTFTARRGEVGHRVFSFPALFAPYAGATTAVYGWYPNRFGAKDALRMGNYSLLESMGANIALEFLYSGPHALLSHLHLNNGHGTSDPGPNQ
jgi:hypothetical protein